MSPASVLAVVAPAFGVRPVDVLDKPKHAYVEGVSEAQQAWVYLLVQVLPRPERYPARAGKTRAAGDRDGNVKAVARLLSIPPSTVRYILHRVEDLRDEPGFDRKLTALEAALVRP